MSQWGPRKIPSTTGALVWTKEVLIQGFQKWRTVIALRRLDGPLSGTSKEELQRWIQHVRAGHVLYSKRCQTCVATSAAGHAHRKVEYPSCYTMSVDVCGPCRVRGHTPEALGNKHMLVAAYVMPIIPGRACGSEDDIIGSWRHSTTRRTSFSRSTRRPATRRTSFSRSTRRPTARRTRFSQSVHQTTYRQAIVSQSSRWRVSMI